MRASSHPPRPEIGDLVEVGGVWNMRGIVLADDSAWWVIKDHYDISNCIVAVKDITSIIEKKAINPEYLKYMCSGGAEIERRIVS